jgi:serine/threonine protein kinase
MLTPGETFDRRYRVKREIASNARAVLFEVEHRYTGRLVALRMLLGSARDNTEMRALLLHEARLLGEIRHRCVVELLDAGEATPLDPYLVTEMLDGRTR